MCIDRLGTPVPPVYSVLVFVCLPVVAMSSTCPGLYCGRLLVNGSVEGECGVSTIDLPTAGCQCCAFFLESVPCLKRSIISFHPLRCSKRVKTKRRMSSRW